MSETGREQSVVGYVLADPNTGALDWDGVVHSTLAGALDEVLGTRDEWLERPRPERGDLPYEVLTVVRDESVQDKAVRHAQKHYDDTARFWERFGDDD